MNPSRKSINTTQQNNIKKEKIKRCTKGHEIKMNSHCRPCRNDYYRRCQDFLLFPQRFLLEASDFYNRCKEANFEALEVYKGNPDYGILIKCPNGHNNRVKINEDIKCKHCGKNNYATINRNNFIAILESLGGQLINYDNLTNAFIKCSMGHSRVVVPKRVIRERVICKLCSRMK